jgi:hypothetical protein
MKRTKVQVIERRMQAAYDTYKGLEASISSLKQMKPPVTECFTCGSPFTSAFDFDAHYLVDDERYLNLGNCPTRYNNNRLMPALHDRWGFKDLWDTAHEENERITVERSPDLGDDISLTRYICTGCGAAYHSDEEKATICNKCTLEASRRDDMRY